MKRKSQLTALIVALPAFVGFACFSWVQPLLSSRAYIVTATLDGTPIHAELLHPPFIPGTYYVRLSEAQTPRYSWFGIAFSRKSVFSPIGVYTGWRGCPYVHTDQAKGVRLTDSKIEDHWNVAFTSGGVQFSNASLSVALSKPQ